MKPIQCAFLDRIHTVQHDTHVLHHQRAGLAWPTPGSGRFDGSAPPGVKGGRAAELPLVYGRTACRGRTCRVPG
jgi:hypothetical protein